MIFKADHYLEKLHAFVSAVQFCALTFIHVYVFRVYRRGSAGSFRPGLRFLKCFHVFVINSYFLFSFVKLIVCIFHD